MEVSVGVVRSNQEVPIELLLLADPSEAHIRQYMADGLVLVAVHGEETVGAVVLVKLDEAAMEIINIAVREEYQGKGIGKKLIEAAVKLCGSMKMRHVEIGTGNSSLMQLGLYQKCGFRICEIWHDHFVKNYEEEIYENGIRCRDMIRLRMELSD